MRPPSGSEWAENRRAVSWSGRDGPLSGFVNLVLAVLAAVAGAVGLKRRRAGAG